MAVLLCYYFVRLCTSKGDISASAIYNLGADYIIFFCLLFRRYAFIGFILLLRWPLVEHSFLSALFSLLSLLQHALSKRVCFRHEHTFLWPSIFLWVSSSRRYCICRSPVPTLGKIVIIIMNFSFLTSVDI